MDHDSPATPELRLRFSPETYDILQELSKRTGKTVPELLADAIGLEKAVSDARQQNYRVLLERNGKYRELLAS